MKLAKKSELNGLAISSSRTKLMHFEIRAFKLENGKQGRIGQNI